MKRMLIIFVAALLFVIGIYFGIQIGKQQERQNQEQYRRFYENKERN